jgi:large subunit ribosomal protein L29
MKLQEIREKSIAERLTLLIELQDKARKLRFDLSLREAKNHREYRKMKKDIARILTIAREEEVVLDEEPKKT